MVSVDDCFSCFLGVLDSFTQTSLMKNIGKTNKQINQGSVFPLRACEQFWPEPYFTILSRKGGTLSQF